MGLNAGPRIFKMSWARTNPYPKLLGSLLNWIKLNYKANPEWSGYHSARPIKKPLPSNIVLKFQWGAEFKHLGEEKPLPFRKCREDQTKWATLSASVTESSLTEPCLLLLEGNTFSFKCLHSFGGGDSWRTVARSPLSDVWVYTTTR